MATAKQTEPNVIINGHILSEAQAMTLRVAIGNFLITLRDDDFMRDLGAVGPHYRDRLIEIERLMLTGRA
jgi:hypothetical protein